MISALTIKDGDYYQEEYDLPGTRYWLKLTETGYQVVTWDFWFGLIRRDEKTGQRLPTHFIHEDTELSKIFNPAGKGTLPRDAHTFVNFSRKVISQVLKGRS